MEKKESGFLNLNDLLLYRVIMFISLTVFTLVVVLNKRVIPTPETFPQFIYTFPKINAIINATCSMLLIASLYCIRLKKIKLHKQINLITFGLSSLFLILYVVYHYLVPETTFGGVGIIKSIYYFILITHIILAALVLPLILLSFQRGLTAQVEKHRKIVRWAFPIWLYVTISGVVVYLMISPYYNF